LDTWDTSGNTQLQTQTTTKTGTMKVPFAATTIFLEIFININESEAFAPEISSSRGRRQMIPTAMNGAPSEESNSESNINTDIENTIGKVSKSQEAFLESSAESGAPEVRKMSIEERTQRAMLAEVAEDRMISLSDELEVLLGEDGLPKKDEYRDEVVALAQQIKASQEQYRALVNGESSPLLEALNGDSEQ
jgi:hypothetical protein